MPRPPAGSRRCVLKARVVPLRGGGIAGARLHLDYIERDGVEKDGSKGQLYAADKEIDRGTLTSSLPGERHQFRFILSPEDADKLDLSAFTRDLMAQVERDTGRRLIWGAVNHHDTDNPHVHVVVRGVDRMGKEVRIEPGYISQRMRWQAQHLITRELGPRTSLEVSRQLGREISQERFTTVDRQLAQVLSRDGTVDIRRLALTTDGATRARLTARLGVLERLALAHRTDARTWRLLDNWEETLRALGQRGDIIKRIHGALRGAGDPGRYAVIDGKTEHGPIEGVVRRKGLHDELRGDMYAVIETHRGQAHYVRLDAETAETLAEGSLVRVEVAREAWAKRTDRVIAQVAAEANGIYDPAVHLRQLASRPIAIGGKAVDATAVLAANLRRLQRLERHQVVSRLPDGRWRVPPNLVELLSQREQSHPKFRTRVEVLSRGVGQEIRYAGPTWLEGRNFNDQARAHYGFGAELEVALRQRAAFLHQIGVRGTQAEIEVALRGHEERTLGTKIAAETKHAFVAKPEVAFRGQVFACEPTPSGAKFLRIVDDASRRFVLMPAGDVSRHLQGKTVELVRDPKGRLVARPIVLSRGV